MRIVFVVDDNLIGNKKAIKDVLRNVSAWQERNGYPLTFFTEASIDLADDPELMHLMVEANVITVFVGIESPNEASLRETRKFQNVRTGGTMLEKVHRIQGAGIEVWCGMIVGFDNDGPSVFDAQARFLEESRIANVLVSLLTAIPKTPLYHRLEREGRLDLSDELEFGTNVISLQLSREELRDGYVRVMNELYEPDAYFGRLEELYLREKIQFCQGAPVLAAPSHRAADGQCVVLGPGGRAVPATDAKDPRGLAPPGVPAPDRAVPQGPPRPGHAALLRVQLCDALSRPLDGPADGQRAHGGVQRVLTAGRRGAMLGVLV